MRFLCPVWLIKQYREKQGLVLTRSIGTRQTDRNIQEKKTQGDAIFTAEEGVTGVFVSEGDIRASALYA